MLRRTFGLPFVALALLTPCFAQTITLRHEGSAPGMLAGVPFTSSPFVITATANVADVMPIPGIGFDVVHAQVTIDITGVGVLDFVSPTRTFVNQNSPIVGFSRAGATQTDLYNGPVHSALATWNMDVGIGPLTGSGTTLQWANEDVITSGGVLEFTTTSNIPCVFTATVGPGGVGTPYCMTNANSTGVPAALSGVGSSFVAANDVTLETVDLPLNSFGFYITSQTQGFIPNPAGSQGNLCLSGAIGRYVGAGQIQSSGMNGTFSLMIDLTQTPTPNGLVSVAAGETWNFQAWYRDAVMGNATSNFSNGLEVGFL